MLKRINADTVAIIREDYKYSQTLKEKIREYSRPALLKKYNISQFTYNDWVECFKLNLPFVFNERYRDRFISMKVDWLKAEKLRTQYKENNMIALCIRYNVDMASISRIVNNKTYLYV